MSARKQPPNSPAAEAAVLSHLMSRRGSDSVRESLDYVAGESFYSGSHRRMFEAVVALHESKNTTDRIAVIAHLEQSGHLTDVGGADGVNAVANSSSVLTPDAFRTYLQAIKNAADRRALLRVVQAAEASIYSGVPNHLEFMVGVERDVKDVVNRASTGKGAWVSVKDTLIDYATSIRKSQGRALSVSTQIEAVDASTGGLYPGDLTILAARPGMGKALALDAKVLTPKGWVLNGDLQVGDLVIGSNGKPHAVLGVYDLGPRQLYRVTTDDGGSTECCDEHLWLTRNRGERTRKAAGRVRDLAEIRSTLLRPGGGLNHSIPFVRPVEFDGAGNLPVRPWLLGMYLGDGYSGSSVLFSNIEADVRTRIASEVPLGHQIVDADRVSVRVRGGVRGARLRDAIRELGLGGARSWEKFIPEPYLLAPIADRIELLRGLCDSDGYVTDPRGCGIEYSTTSPRLRDDIVFLVGSLGGRVTWSPKAGAYSKGGVEHPCREYYRMNISFPTGGVLPVSSEKHLAKYKKGPRRITERFIKSVKPSRVASCRCIKVAAPDALYVTDDFLVTHNTSFALGCAEGVSMQRGYGDQKQVAAMFSLEMTSRELALRLVCGRSGLSYETIRKGIPASETSRFAEGFQKVGKLPFHTDDTSGLTVAEMRRRCWQLATRCEREDNTRLSLVVVDYLQLMNMPAARHESQVDAIGNVTKALKGLAKELQIPVLVLSQLNRSCEDREDKRPRKSDLRGSGRIEEDADNIWLLYRHGYYHPKHDPGETELIVAKQRGGKEGTIMLHFNGPSTSFDRHAPVDADHEEFYSHAE